MKFIFCCLLFFTLAYAAKFGGEFYFDAIKSFGRAISGTGVSETHNGADFLMTILIPILFVLVISMCFFMFLIFVFRTSTFLLFNYIPLLIASTGSNLDAEIAGKIPEINPMAIANPEPNKILLKLNTKSKSSNLVKPIAIIQTKKIPIIPPIKQRITASNKN